MIADRQLTKNFTLYELTRTDRADLQEKNREITEEQVAKLAELAALGEQVRELWMVPVKVNSAYRCPELNRAEGSTDRSQHLLCEAMDVVPLGIDIGDAFRTLWKAVKDGRIKVGQLIFETAIRSYGETSWIHVSLGAPWREASRCAQILRMEHGRYTLLA